MIILAKPESLLLAFKAHGIFIKENNEQEWAAK
jgi:hypothetical protein